MSANYLMRTKETEGEVRLPTLRCRLYQIPQTLLIYTSSHQSSIMKDQSRKSESIFILKLTAESAELSGRIEKIVTELLL